MGSDLDKYRAQNLQIAGFCLMSPLGKLILNVPEYKLGDIDLKFVIYFIVALMFFCFGIICVFRGEIHLEKERVK